jgi:hypothetical protein
MPMIVIAKKNAVTTWASASHQPASTSQMMFYSTEPAPAVGFFTTVRPKGHSEYPASLKACTPNGIVMMRMNITMPATAFRSSVATVAGRTMW